MMKKYIQPEITVQKIEAESLLAGGSGSGNTGVNNDYSGQPQRVKPWNDDYEQDDEEDNFSNLWADNQPK